jgi:8-oxo-dGTP pyrophosphatase MutT (NUDIX family)
MAATVRLFPMHQLPPGYGGTLDDPPYPPASPRPASTLVLLRNGPQGIETLLLQRSRRMGFIPGAFVFPGGGVDRDDGHPGILPHMAGLSPAEAGARLGVQKGEAEAAAFQQPPPMAYFVAALRETFEETGILLGVPPLGCRTVPAGGGSREGEVRARLLEGRCTFSQALSELASGEPAPGGMPPREAAPDPLAGKLDAGSLRYIGRWVTPEPEPRRYDTRFFAVEVPAGCGVEPHRAEVEESLWLTPMEALQRNRAGLLPLVYPTLRTLEDLVPSRDVVQALEHFQGRHFPPLLPRLRRKPAGIQIIVDEPA